MKNEYGYEEVVDRTEVNKIMLKFIACNPTILSSPETIVSLLDLYDKGFIHVFKDGTISLREDKKELIHKILGLKDG